MGDLGAYHAVITGASRGIGRAIALKLAAQGAAITILAKSDQPHPTLDGTIHSVAAEIEAAGGRALPLAVDIREEDSVTTAMARAADHFGGIDALINNASAIHMAATPDTPLKRYDLMMDVNMRGTFTVTQAALPYLLQSPRAGILTLSPPLNIGTKWLGVSPAYTASKMGMSLLTIGFAREYDGKISANTLWPATMIATAAIKVNFPALYPATRDARIVAEAADYILNHMTPRPNGQHFTDEQVLRLSGVTDITAYALDPSLPPAEDIFLDGWAV
jgi:citronellol/citronellal dehydrogenase